MEDARSRRDVARQQSMDEDRWGHARRSATPCRGDVLRIGHHGARLDHHDARTFLGHRPTVCGNRQPLDVVPS
ncbi:hypothetical protein G6F17_014372 [Rhizopus arrhizus]|nr:hypothetical protein G6F17_014372 [Rhizopus arrhizus]